MVRLANEHLTVEVSSHGAELCSIRGNASGQEYLWQADPTYWKRHSPVLFPIVGSVWENQYRHADKSYPLSQHGFARDMDFELVSQSETEVLFRLESNEETLAKYPFPFRLEIGYQLIHNQVKVLWSVYNPASTDMYFQIGAHPAFYYPDYMPETTERGYFSFDQTDNLSYILISEKGCVSLQTYPLNLQDGLLPLDTHTFDHDALILENGQVNEVRLLDKNKQPYLSLQFSAPVVGLWSPPAKNAPFVCIEPWYGRCDRAHYTSEYKDKDWMQHLSGNEEFHADYTICLERE